MPVMKLDQATGLNAGMVVAKGRNEPISASFLKFGARPVSIRPLTIVGSRPSKPRTITFRPSAVLRPQELAKGKLAAAALPARSCTKRLRSMGERMWLWSVMSISLAPSDQRSLQAEV